MYNKKTKLFNIILLLLFNMFFLLSCGAKQTNDNLNQINNSLNNIKKNNNALINNEKSYILIEGAVNDEIKYLLDILENKENRVEEGYTYYLGTIEGKDIIILKTFVGEINAALSTKYIVDNYKIKGIINQGTLGGYKKYLQIGDIIIADKIYNKDAYKMKIIDDDESYLDFKTYIDVGDCLDQYLESDKYFIEKAKNIEYENGKVYVGNIASGDSWYDDINIIEKYSNEFDLYGEEMEGYAALLIAKKYNIPFLSARIVSNLIYIDTPYDANIAEKEVGFIKRLLNIFVD